MTAPEPRESRTSNERVNGAELDESQAARLREHELPFRSELQRKALHVLALAIPISMLLLGRTASILILLPLTFLALGADVLRVRSAGFSKWLHGTFGFMMRPDERPPLGASPAINGATWVLISATLLVILFPIGVAVAAFASFIVADAAAAVIGRRFGRKRWPQTSRTVEGSVAFVLIGVPAMLPFADISIATAAVAVVVGAALEIPHWRLNDNVRVPIAMALVLRMLGT